MAVVMRLRHGLACLPQACMLHWSVSRAFSSNSADEIAALNQELESVFGGAPADTDVTRLLGGSPNPAPHSSPLPTPVSLRGLLDNAEHSTIDATLQRSTVDEVPHRSNNDVAPQHLDMHSTLVQFAAGDLASSSELQGTNGQDAAAPGERAMPFSSRFLAASAAASVPPQQSRVNQHSSLTAASARPRLGHVDQQGSGEAASAPPWLSHVDQHGSFAAAAAQPQLSHVDQHGSARMVDVTQKPGTARSASASARVLLGAAAFDAVSRNAAAKGDVLKVAEVAGVMAAKHTHTLIPLCHALLLTKVSVSLELDAAQHSVHVSSHVRCVGATGVEMEALTAAAVAALTVYDMCKAVSKSIVVTDLRLESKAGGKSGEWARGTVDE